MISERYVIPVLVAAAAHAALFVIQPVPTPRGGRTEPGPMEPP